MKITFTSIAIFFSLLPAASAYEAHDRSGTDWRKTADTDEKVENLVEVMPGASNLMLQMGDRYRNLYWAGKKGQWKFAEYQIEEMQDLVETLMITRPKRAATAGEFLQDGFARVLAATEKRNWARFEAGFESMRQACMTCHIKNDHAFIVLPPAPAWAPSPALETNRTAPAL